MVKFIHTRPYYGYGLIRGSKYHSPYVQAIKLRDRLKGHLVDVRCPELEADDISSLLKCFSICYSPLIQVIVYLECYYRCDSKVREFIESYFKRSDFPRKVIVIVGDLIDVE